MGKVLFMRKGEVHTAPKKPGLELSTLAEGSIVYLNESGSAIPFYVAKHDYQSGRTLLARKDVHSKQKWDSGSDNRYAGSSIDTWLNGTYKGLLDADVQTAIGTTTFYYTVGNKDTTKTKLSRSVFLLSMYENGNVSTNANLEGSNLPISDLFHGATLNGETIAQWTRTPVNTSNTYVFYINRSGTGYGSMSAGSEAGIRPCFTLPSTAKFDSETLLFKEVG